MFSNKQFVVDRIVDHKWDANENCMYYNTSFACIFYNWYNREEMQEYEYWKNQGDLHMAVPTVTGLRVKWRNKWLKSEDFDSPKKLLFKYQNKYL